MLDIKEEDEDCQINIDHYISRSNNGKTFLNLCDLKLKEIPKDAFDRVDVTNLFLSNNSISEIPAEIAKLQNLEAIIVDFNALETLPPEICTLKR